MTRCLGKPSGSALSVTIAASSGGNGDADDGEHSNEQEGANYMEVFPISEQSNENEA